MANIEKLFLDKDIAPAVKEPPAAPARKSPTGKRIKLFAGLALTVAALGGGYYAYDTLYLSKHATTDNAYVGADLAQVTPLVSGPVREVLANDTRHVKRGDVLVRLDDIDFKIAIARSQAALAAARANLGKAKIDLARRQALAASGSVSGDELTTAQNAYSTAAANLQAADAANHQAQIDLERTVLRAPIDGVISERQVQVGQRVQAGTPLMVVVPLQTDYVDANFKEVQLAHVHILSAHACFLIR
jgi:membrane fusion protein (multidrug efflux system)